MSISAPVAPPNMDISDSTGVGLGPPMTSDQLVRMKPQNLLAGLPIKHLEAAI